jgi:triosephosphate isomerase
MTDRRPLIAGNWKMNRLRADGLTLAGELVEGVRDRTLGCELLVCPPATLLAPIAALVHDSAVALGAQDCHPEDSGAHTGDIGAPMLADLGCTHVIVGHSERRADHGETDALVQAKAAAAHRASLTAIICVGETEAERDRGVALDVIANQLKGSLPAAASAANTVIAYEPVWAIGTGRTPSPADVREVHALIRERLNAGLGVAGAALRILYGGSVKPENAAELLAVEDVDGALVGGASLDAADFLAIAANCP